MPAQDAFFFKSGSGLRVKFNERLWMQLCLNWKLIDWERPDLLLYLGDKSSYLNWCKYKKKTFMKRTCQLYNNGRFSPIRWQFSASSSCKTNNWQMRKIKQRRDFFSNCTSFLLCCVDQTLWWYSIVNCNIWIQPLHSIEIEKFWIECNACLPTDDDNSKLEIKVFSKVLF